MMRVLMVHNRYLFRGGEDVVAEAERDLLAARGHDVHWLEWDNSTLARAGAAGQIAMLWRPTWSREAYHRMRTALRTVRPDVVHVHNFFPMVSPAVFYAAARARVPIVYTLHNYRPLCANALFFRNGKPCTECVAYTPVRGLAYGCYRGSRLATLPVVLMQLLHRYAGTWMTKVSVYVAPSVFAKEQFVRAGFPEERIVVKPHFVPDPGVAVRRQAYAVFIGQLAEKKGVAVLLDAWRRVPLPLVMIGDGPLQPAVTRMVEALGLRDRVTLAGRLPLPEVMAMLGAARCLVLPSLHHEGFPRVVVEAFACGVPVVASDLPPLNQIVRHGETGLLVQAGDGPSLAQAISVLGGDGARLAAMQRAARAEFERHYTAERNYEQILQIYRQAMRAAPLQEVA